MRKWKQQPKTYGTFMQKIAFAVISPGNANIFPENALVVSNGKRTFEKLKRNSKE